MHVERLKKVRNLIANSPDFPSADKPPEALDNIKFNMSYFLNTSFGDSCGTICCIAGFAALLAAEEGITSRKALTKYHAIEETAQEYLDLTSLEMHHLFYGIDGQREIDLDNVTKEDAVKTIDHFIKTGDIQWFNLK